MPTDYILPLACAVLMGFGVHWITKPKPNHPPGPKRYPIIGNLLNFPRDHFYDAFTRWQKEYGEYAHTGDVAYVNFFGQPIYVINSREKAEELLSKRGNAHSGRPQQILPRYMLGWEDWNVALVQPGKAHTELRGLLMKGLSTSVIPSYDAMIDQIVHEQVLKLLVGQTLDPRDLTEEAVAEVLVRIGYGDSLSTEQKKELLEANRIALKYTLESNTTGLVLLLDVAPFLRFYPRWLPGGNFRNWTAHCKQFVQYIRYKPWESVLQDVKDGVVRESFASRLISHEGPTDRVRDVLAFLYFTGAETTTTAVLTAIYVLLMYPEVQAKAHAELDAVIGHEQPPTAKDRERLPYLDALWKESLRWHPPGPVNIPHVSTKDDTWEGYVIPKGSSIFVNSGFILRDPRLWDDPEVFRPERFLRKEPPPFDPLSVVFGFGRRNCPGRYLADRQGFIFIAAILWAFKIEPAPGEARLDPSKASFIDSLAAAPEPFRCSFVPRSRKLEEYCKNL